MSKEELLTDAFGVTWKVVTLPDKSGGETALAIEQPPNPATLRPAKARWSHPQNPEWEKRTPSL